MLKPILPPEQVYPLGQQCSPSEQQTAFGRGQHPYCPLDSLQHVFPEGHSDWPSGHTTDTDFNWIDDVFKKALITWSPFVQKPWKLKLNK